MPYSQCDTNLKRKEEAMHCYLIWISSSWPWAGRGEERREGVGGFFFKLMWFPVNLSATFMGNVFLEQQNSIISSFIH